MYAALFNFVDCGRCYDETNMFLLFLIFMVYDVMQANELTEEGADADAHPDVNAERTTATLYTKRWVQMSKDSRAVENVNSSGIDMVRPSGDMEEATSSDALDEDAFKTFALVTAQTKHFYQLDKKKLVGRHADEGGIWALRDLSLALQYGECFGLLGPNGAGKSTLISILSGILKSTAGFQFIGGQSLQSIESSVHNVVGFCPQFDVVWNNLSGILLYNNVCLFI
jgi:ABC-type glutathione transport system ATPase component